MQAPLLFRGGAVSLSSNAERLAVEWHASSPSKIEGVAQGPGAYESNYDRQGRMKVTMTDGVEWNNSYCQINANICIIAINYSDSHLSPKHFTPLEIESTTNIILSLITPKEGKADWLPTTQGKHCAKATPAAFP